MLGYLSGKDKESPHKELIFFNDEGKIVAVRAGDWKAVYLENRAHGLDVWRDPFTELRLPPSQTPKIIQPRERAKKDRGIQHSKHKQKFKIAIISDKKKI